MKNVEIEIVFTKSKKKFAIGSWIIMAYTGKPFSHVAKAVEIRDWGKGYYQASEGKVNYEYEPVFKKKHNIVKKYILKIPENLDTEIRKACWQDAGKKYASMQNLGIVLVDIARLFNIKMTNPWKDGRNCSELLYLKVFKQLKPDLDYDPDTIKPHHIEEIIEAHFQHLILD